MLTVAKARKLPAASLSTSEKAVVRAVLDALGKVRVLRAMTRVCRPKYKNNGWSNCFLTQAFGGAANFERMVASYHLESGIGLETNAIATALALPESTIDEFVDLFDDNAVVVSLLRYVAKWLENQGINVNLTWDPSDEDAF